MTFPRAGWDSSSTLPCLESLKGRKFSTIGGDDHICKKHKSKKVVQVESSGGVVYRRNEGQLEVVICGRETPYSTIWGLPKGTPDPGETRKQTALREVNEETGLEVEIEAYIGDIDYWFARPGDGARCHKSVYYYLMSPTGGDLSLHDHEFDYVKWSSIEGVRQTLTYENEVRIVEDALSLVSKKARTG